MDQYLSTIIVTLITGTFGVITLLLQKKSDKVVNKIDKQTVFIEKEKEVRQKLTLKEKERDLVMHEVMMLILETNLKTLKRTDGDTAVIVDESVYQKARDLKERFDKLTEEIEDINKEYEIVLDMITQFKIDTDGEGSS